MSVNDYFCKMTIREVIIAYYSPHTIANKRRITKVIKMVISIIAKRLAHYDLLQSSRDHHFLIILYYH